MVKKFADGFKTLIIEPMLMHTEMYDFLAANAIDILTGRKSPQEVMDEAEELRQRLLKEGKVIPLKELKVD